MRELNLDQLRTLVAITDLGTFSAAAQGLHLAQPTVSLHVSELESRLGTPLVVRGGRASSPRRQAPCWSSGPAACCATPTTRSMR
jgi:DNA-binding transcriptional LysR family regulator